MPGFGFSKTIKNIIFRTTNGNVLDNERLLFFAMPFSPVVDGKMIKNQPYEDLLNGNFDTSKNIIMGMTEHETEIYVRSLFRDPVNDIVMKAGMRAIFNGFKGPAGESGLGKEKK